MARLMRTGSAIPQASQEGYLLRRSVGETRIRQKFTRPDWTVRGSTDKVFVWCFFVLFWGKG